MADPVPNPNEIDGPDARLDPAINEDMFKNRRRMSWMMLFSVLFFMCILFFYIPFDHVSFYDSVFNGFMMFAASVVLTYMGSSVAQTFLANYPRKAPK
jgi:hypothetical protein